MTKHQTDPVDQDLIDLVQRARMAHDAQAKPSTIAAVYWVEAKPQLPIGNGPTARAGCWSTLVEVAKVDAVWQQIKQATEQGALGYKAKVTTMAPPGAVPSLRQVMVCTYDADDQADVKRVKQALDELAFTAEWHYARVNTGEY